MTFVRHLLPRNLRPSRLAGLSIQADEGELIGHGGFRYVHSATAASPVTWPAVTRAWSGRRRSCRWTGLFGPRAFGCLARGDRSLDEDRIAPHDRRRRAAAGNLHLPAYVFSFGPRDWRIARRRHAARKRATPLGPIVLVRRAGDGNR